MNEPFWLKPKTVTLNDGTVVTLSPEEPAWEMFSTLSEGTLEFLPIPFTMERVVGHFNRVFSGYCDECRMGLVLG